MTTCAACLAAAVLLGAGTVRLAAVELIENGSFEADGAVDGAFLTGWDNGNDGAATLEYPRGDCGDDWCIGAASFDVPGPPSSGVSGPHGRGSYYAYAFGTGTDIGGTVEFEGFSAQIVDVQGYATKPFSFSAWLASGVPDKDYAIVTLEFFREPRAEGPPLDSFSFAGNDQQSPFIAGSANIEGLADPSIPATQDNWTFYRATGIVPLDAVSATVSIAGRSTDATGFINNGFVDLVSLQVVPEPSSALLTISLAALAAARCVHRKAIARTK